MKLLLAGVGVRAQAEAARRQGFDVVALDVFGDADTRAAAQAWACVGDAATLTLDAQRLDAALRAHAGGAVGWVPGSGLEALPAWPQIDGLPLLGARGPACAADWLAALAALGLPHPPSRLTPPDDLIGWLRKDLGSCGGAGVRRAEGGAAGARIYWQREQIGQPLSLTYLANGQSAIGIGVNHLLVRAGGPGMPFGHAGVCAARDVPPGVADALLVAARRLTAHFGLKGLGSVDALWRAGQGVQVLEVNARIPASHALYPDAPLMRWHVQACLEGSLPLAVRPGFALPERARAHGQMLVFAPQAGVLRAPLLRLWASRAGVHDVALPDAAPIAVPAGAPLCTVSAQGDDVPARLAAAHTRILDDWKAHHVH